MKNALISIGHLKMRKDSKNKHDTSVEYAIQTNRQ